MDRGSELYKKNNKTSLTKYEREICSTYGDLKAVFIEGFNGKILHIVNKPRFINDNVILASLLTDAALTYINSKHTTKI